MEEGFRNRAAAVRTLLADPSTAYVLVTSGRPDAITETTFFAEKLAERDVTVAALVVNRMAPSFGNGILGDALGEPVVGMGHGAMEALERNLAAVDSVAAREEAAFASLAAKVAPAPVARIPLFGDDVHELHGLRRAADCVMG